MRLRIWPTLLMAFAASAIAVSTVSASDAPIGASIVHKAGLLPLSQRGGIDLNGSNKGVFLIRHSNNQFLAAGSLLNNQIRFDLLNDPGQNFRLVGLADFDRNGLSDLIFQNVTQGESGEVRVWNDFIRASDKLLRNVKLVWNLEAVGDLDGDGFPDLVWRYNVAGSPDTGVSYIWFTNGTAVTQVRKRGGAPLNWALLGAMDLNRDGAADMVYVAPDGAVRVLMATASRTCANFSAGSIPGGYSALRFDDFTGRGRGDLLLRNPTTGDVRLLSLNATYLQLPPPGSNPDDQNASCSATTEAMPAALETLPSSDRTWRLYGTADLNGDGTTDIVWATPAGTMVVWLLSPTGSAPTVLANAGNIPGDVYSAFPNIASSVAPPAAATTSLAVLVTGRGTGLVTSTPNGISCSGACSAQFNTGATVTLRALPTSGSTFVGWSGACASNATCVVSLEVARSVTATFSSPLAAASAAPVESLFSTSITNATQPAGTIKTARSRFDLFVESSANPVMRGVTVTSAAGEISRAFFSGGALRTLVGADGGRVEVVSRTLERTDYQFFSTTNAYTGGFTVVRSADSPTWSVAAIIGASALQTNNEISGSFGGTAPGSFSIFTTPGSELDSLQTLPTNVSATLEEFYKLNVSSTPPTLSEWQPGAVEGPPKMFQQKSLFGSSSSRNATAAAGFGLAAVVAAGVCLGTIVVCGPSTIALVGLAGLAMNVTGAASAAQSLAARAGQQLLGDSCANPDPALASFCSTLQDDMLGVQDDPISSLRNRVNAVVDGVSNRWSGLTQSISSLRDRFGQVSPSDASRFMPFDNSQRPAAGVLPGVDSGVTGLAVSQLGNVPYSLTGIMRRNGSVTASGKGNDGTSIQVNGTLAGTTFNGATTISRAGVAGQPSATSGAARPVSSCNTVTESGGQGAFSRSYSIGAGTVFSFSYDAYTIPDAFTVFTLNRTSGQWAQAFSTGGLVSGRGNQNLSTGGSPYAAVTVTAPNQGTAWEFTLGCAR